jgi:hypothetical protein
VFVDVERSLWREDGSVIYNILWPSLAQSFSNPSPVGLATIFYCLRFETSPFVAFYDSQGCAVRIRAPIIVAGEPNRDHSLQGFQYCLLSFKKSLPWICLCPKSVATIIRCRGKVFHRPLPSNGRLFWLHHSGFQALCNNVFHFLCPKIGLHEGRIGNQCFILFPLYK